VTLRRLSPSRSTRPGGPLRRLVGRLRRAFGADRVLQLEEVRVAVAEHLEGAALRGLSRRYLPARVRVRVSEDDLRFLEPFGDRVRQEVASVVRELASRPGWRRTVDEAAVELSTAADLAPGALPRVEVEYADGPRRAVWQPPEAGEQASPEMPAAAGRAASGLLEVVITAASGDGTALQERFQVCLDPALPAAALHGVDLSETVVLRLEGSCLVRGPSDEPWNAPPPAEVGVLPGLDATHGVPGVPRDALSAPWLRARAADGATLLWCPAGALVIGRGDSDAHLAPESAPQALSRRHCALVRAADGRLAVADLESTNGTFLDGRPVAPGLLVPLNPPAMLSAGIQGTVTMELR